MNNSIIKHSEEDWDRHFLDIAELCSKMSKDPSTKVGCVIRAPDKSIVSTGYNGFPASIPDNKEYLENREIKYTYIIHAEENAIKFATNTQDSRSRDLSLCTLYTTLFPCEKCYNLIRKFGIKKIVTLEPTESQLERWGQIFEIVKEKSIRDSIEISKFSRA